MLRSLAVKSRDNARTPMQWDDTAYAGFTTGEPWLPVNPNHTDDQCRCGTKRTRRSVFTHYQALSSHSVTPHPLVVDGRLRAAPARPPSSCGSSTRALTAASGSLVLANCSSEPVSVGAPDLADLAGLSDLVDPTAGAEAGAAILVATHPGRAGSDLLPWESRVYELGAPAG